MKELRDQSVGQRFIDAVTLGLMSGQVQCAEQAIDEGQQRRVIFVEDGGTVVCVMPVVEGRRGDEPLEWAEAPAKIGVNEEAPDRAEQQDEQRNQTGAAFSGRGEAEDVERDEATETREHHVDRMSTGIYEKVDVLGAVMDGVKPPQQGDFVAQAMSPIETDIADEQGRTETQPSRPSGDCHCKSGRHYAMNTPGDQSERRGKKETRDQAAQEVVADVGPNRFAEQLLVVKSEEPFQRGKEHREQGKPNAEA